MSKIEPKEIDSSILTYDEKQYLSIAGQLVAHHYLAQTGLWNEDERFEALNLTAGNTIMYAGGNTDGADGVKLLTLCPQW